MSPLLFVKLQVSLNLKEILLLNFLFRYIHCLSFAMQNYKPFPHPIFLMQKCSFSYFYFFIIQKFFNV